MKFQNTEVWGFEHAFRGMRNPKESWRKSDSIIFQGCIQIGENDKKLAQSLISGGTEHRKFLRQIFVSVDITAPLYWWKEFDTYKVGTTANSTSTMHKLTDKPITLESFEIADYSSDLIDVVKDNNEYCVDETIVSVIIPFLENLRKKYKETHDKRYWKELVRWLPEGWLQTRTVTMNYENIYSMIRQRKDHKLNEWSGRDDFKLCNFVSWAKELPCAKELLFYGLEEINGN